MVDLLERGERIQIHSANDMDSFVASGEEYLPVNTVLDDLRQEYLFVEEGIEISDYTKTGTTIRFHCENTAEKEGRLELPLLYYEGYQATGRAADGTSFPIEVSAGQNNVVSLELDAGMEGDVVLEFVEPWYWRMAEIVSVICLGVAIWYGYSNKGGRLWKQS